MLHLNGVSWTKQATPSPPVGPKLYGAAATGPSTVWGAGYRYDQRAAATGPSTVWGAGYRYDQRAAANQTLTIRTTNG